MENLYHHHFMFQLLKRFVLILYNQLNYWYENRNRNIFPIYIIPVLDIFLFSIQVNKN